MASFESSASLSQRWNDDADRLLDDGEEHLGDGGSDILVQQQSVKKARTRAPVGRGQVKDVVIHINKCDNVMNQNIFRAVMMQAPIALFGGGGVADTEENVNYVNVFYRQFFEKEFLAEQAKYLQHNVDKNRFGKQTALRNLCFLFKPKQYGRLHNFFKKDTGVTSSALIKELTGGGFVKSKEHARFLRSELTSTKPFALVDPDNPAVQRIIEPEHFKWRLFFEECGFTYTFNQIFIRVDNVGEGEEGLVRPWDFFGVYIDVLPSKKELKDREVGGNKKTNHKKDSMSHGVRVALEAQFASNVE